MNLTLLDTQTGERVDGTDNFSDDPSWVWVEGNYACDCNRENYFGRGDAEAGRGECTGAHRYLLVACDHPDFDYFRWNGDYPPELLREHRPDEVYKTPRPAPTPDHATFTTNTGYL